MLYRRRGFARYNLSLARVNTFYYLGIIMATASKKTASAIKTVTGTVAKKPAANKVITEVKTTKTAVAAAKKTVAKTPVAKTLTVQATAKKTTTPIATVKQAASPKTATVEPKAPSAKKPAAKKTTAPASPQQRYHMISTAAYYLAERRGFAGGYEMQDWISAELGIDAKLNP